MKNLSHLKAGDLIAFPRERCGDSRIPELWVIEVSRTTNAFLYYISPYNPACECKVSKESGRIGGAYVHAVEATPETIEKNKEQVENFNKYIKLYKEFSEILVNNGKHLTAQQLDILCEAWGRCKALKKSIQ